MLGYLNKPEETRKALEGGWLHTGDIAVRNPDGFLRIVDRKKDMIVSGGFVDEIPLSPVGKPDKKALRAQYGG